MRRLTPGLAACWVALALTVSAAAGAVTDAERADAFFRAGSAAFERRDYAAAALSFESAYAALPRAAAAFNAALAWEAAGDKVRAANALATALAGVELDPDQARDATKRLQALEPELGRLTIVAPAGASVSLDGIATRADREVYVAPGEHTLRAVDSTGVVLESAFAIGAGERRSVELAPEPAPTPTPKPKLEPRRVTPKPPPPRVEAPTADRTWSWVAWGGAVVGGVATGVLGVQALAARDDFEGSGRIDRDARDRAASLRTWTNVALGVSGALVVTGVVLWFTAPAEPDRGPRRGDRTVRARLGVAATPTSVALRLSF